jgi:hypothetical protein
MNSGCVLDTNDGNNFLQQKTPALLPGFCVGGIA